MPAQQEGVAAAAGFGGWFGGGGGGDGDGDTSDNIAQVVDMLAQLDLAKYGPALLALEADSLQHLQTLEEAHLEKMGMPRLHRRALLRALGGAPVMLKAAAAAAWPVAQRLWRMQRSVVRSSCSCAVQRIDEEERLI